MAGCQPHFPIRLRYWVKNLLCGVIFISNSKLTLGPEKGETSNNILTIYPIQSVQRSPYDEYIVASQQEIGFF